MRRSLILCAFLVVAGLVADAGGAGLAAADDRPQATSAYEELLQDGLTQGLPGVAAPAVRRMAWWPLIAAVAVATTAFAFLYRG